jgi:hypothetical protein
MSNRIAFALGILMLSSAAAVSAQPAALGAGSMLIGGTASVRMDRIGENDTWQATLLPRVEYFVSRGLSAGGQAGVTYVRQGEASASTVSVGPAVTYYFVGGGTVHPYLRGAANLARTSLSQSDASVSLWRWTGAAGVLLLLNEAVGLDAQLLVSRADSDARNSEAVTTVGLVLGISAFVF